MTRSLKILIVQNHVRSTAQASEDRAVDREHDALAAAGHDARRLGWFGDDPGRLAALGRALAPVRAQWHGRPADRLDGVLEDFRPDVVHLHDPFPPIGPPILRSCQRQRVPCVVTFHDYRPVCPSGNLFRSGSVCRDCVGRTLPVPAAVHGCSRMPATAVPLAVGATVHRRLWQTVPSAYIFLSEAQRRELEPLGVPLQRSFVKPSLVFPVSFDVPRQPLVAYLGPLSEEAGLRQLMQAWDRYARIQPTPRLHLAVTGSGPLEGELGNWARSRSSVTVLGPLGRGRRAALVSRARTVVVPSEWPDPFAEALAEAMAAGAAPIATEHGSSIDLVTDGVDGLLYPPGDVDALARLLRLAEEVPEWLLDLGRAAKEKYRQRLDPAGNVAELESIYRFAIEHPPWRPSPITLQPPTVRRDR